MYTDFSSLPPEQEREFVVFEQRTRESEKSALRVGGIVAVIYGLLVIAIVLSYDKPPPLIQEEDIAVTDEKRRVGTPDEDEDLTPPAETAPAPEEAAPTPTPEGAEGAEGVEGAAGAEGAEGAGDVPVAPPPKAGATKASPTDLVKANQ